MSSRLVFGLVVLSLLAGCIGKPTDSGAKPLSAGNVTAPSSNATLPDGRGQSAGNLETNKTETGAGGVDHKHDYWKGAESVVIYSRNVAFQTTPIFPGGQGSQPAAHAYIKVPKPLLVFEGTVEVVIEAKDPTFFGATPDAAPPAIKMQYRTAADDKFRDGPALGIGAPVSIKVNPKETDMPHSTSSLWGWTLTTDKPDLAQVNLTITIKKGAEVVNWPGHPDFYAEKSARVVMDKDSKVHRSGIDEGLLYGSGSTWQAPEKLVSYGTGTLDVFLNITSTSSSNGATPANYFLEYHNATILDAEDQFSARVHDAENKNDLKSYHFVIKVDPEGMDGPYQPSSRWAFRPTASFTYTTIPGQGSVGLCPGCFPYDIAYHITVIAHKSDDGMSGMTM